jgi:hypothetical protein
MGHLKAAKNRGGASHREEVGEPGLWGDEKIFPGEFEKYREIKLNRIDFNWHVDCYSESRMAGPWLGTGSQKV